MLDHLSGASLQLAIGALPISFVGWLGFWLFVRSVGIARGSSSIGGPYIFLAAWGLAVLVNINTYGMASFAVEALYFSLAALGCLTWLIATLISTFTDTTRHHRGTGDKRFHA